MRWLVEHEPVLVNGIAHVDVEPAVAVYIGARDTRCRAEICVLTECRIRDVREAAVPVVQQQVVMNRLSKSRRILVVAHSRPEVQSIADDPTRPNIQVLVAVVVKVARDRAAAVAFRKSRARILSHVAEVAVSLIAIQQVAISLVRSNVQVTVSITIIVEYHDGRAIVAYLVAVLEKLRRYVDERGYLSRFLFHPLRSLLHLSLRTGPDDDGRQGYGSRGGASNG